MAHVHQQQHHGGGGGRPPEPLQYDAQETAELFQMMEQKDERDPLTRRGGVMDHFAEEGEGEDEGEPEPALTEDAYSLLYTARFCSRTTFFALCVVALQAGMLLVTFFDLVDFGDPSNETNGKRNRMSIPAGATIPVRLSQFLGMILTVMLMAAEGDIVVGFSQLVEGYDADIRQDMPHATAFRWFFTAVLQMLVGIVLLIDSFILSMQATSVIDLVLNLTALYFIQEVDDIAFTLADMGILSNRVQEDCERVKNLKQVAPPEFSRWVTLWKRVLLGMLTVGLLTSYCIVVAWQISGEFLCRDVYIQFGDAYHPEWAYYSGEFHLQPLKGINGRPLYVDETETLQLAFCGADSAWTVSINKGEPCDYIYRSSETETFDVIEVAGSPWFVDGGDTGDSQVDWFKMFCNDCNEDHCEHGTCDDDNNQCVCEPDWIGVNCELSRPACSFQSVDQRTVDTLASIPGASFFLNNEFVSLQIFNYNVTLHHRYIYVPYNVTVLADYYSIAEVGNINAFMLFTGRRWVIYSIPQETRPTLTGDDFIKFWNQTDSANNPVGALKNVTEFFKGFSPIFFSTPVDYGGPSYGADPSSVGWVLAKNHSNCNVVAARPDDEQPVAARLLCSDCSVPEGACQNGGLCLQGYCRCSYFYQGYQCERAVDCVDNGGCFLDQGECNYHTKVCDCKGESYGNLCQYGPNELEDPFFCAKCVNSIDCDVFARQCNCSSGYGGINCGTFAPAGWDTNISSTTTSDAGGEWVTGPGTLSSGFWDDGYADFNGTFSPTLTPTMTMATVPTVGSNLMNATTIVVIGADGG